MQPSNDGDTRARLTAGELLARPELAQTRLIAGATGLSRPIEHARIQKSGLLLVGHAQGVVPTRVQIFGETELSYLESLAPEIRVERCRFLFSLGLSLVIMSRGVEPPGELSDHAEQSATPLAVAPLRSSATISVVHELLDELLAPTAQLHGVLVEIHGIGVLLLGPSGIGKSECALFLVERGHRLIADDVVVLTGARGGVVYGACAPLLKHHLEIRGLGVLNVRDLFGATAVCDRARIELVVELCPFRADDVYDRLGLEQQTTDLLGQPIRKLRVPVRPGRDMGLVLEIAARDQLLKREGIDGARRFAERLERYTAGHGRRSSSPAGE